MGGDITQTVAAGLPNITGAIISTNNNITPLAGNKQDFTETGALYINQDNQSKISYTIAGSFGVKDLSFDASRSDAIYGAADTVQPPAIQLLPQIKY